MSERFGKFTLVLNGSTGEYSITGFDKAGKGDLIIIYYR